MLDVVFIVVSLPTFAHSIGVDVVTIMPSGWMDLVTEDLTILESKRTPKQKAPFIVW